MRGGMGEAAEYSVEICVKSRSLTATRSGSAKTAEVRKDARPLAAACVGLGRERRRPRNAGAARPDGRGQRRCSQRHQERRSGIFCRSYSISGVCELRSVRNNKRPIRGTPDGPSGFVNCPQSERLVQIRLGKFCCVLGSGLQVRNPSVRRTGSFGGLSPCRTSCARRHGYRASGNHPS